MIFAFQKTCIYFTEVYEKVRKLTSGQIISARDHFKTDILIPVEILCDFALITQSGLSERFKAFLLISHVIRSNNFSVLVPYYRIEIME